MKKAKAGDLFLTILQYVNDENPVVEDPIVDLVFEPIKLQLKRDLKKWEKEKGERSDAGRLGGIKSGETRRSKTKQNEAKRSSASKNEANEAVTVTVTVTDNVTDTVSIKSALVETYLKDLENCSHIFTICRDLDYERDYVISTIPEFRKFTETEYADFNKFVYHFKGWLRKNPPPSNLKKMVY